MSGHQPPVSLVPPPDPLAGPARVVIQVIAGVGLLLTFSFVRFGPGQMSPGAGFTGRDWLIHLGACSPCLAMLIAGMLVGRATLAQVWLTGLVTGMGLIMHGLWLFRGPLGPAPVQPPIEMVRIAIGFAAGLQWCFLVMIGLFVVIEWLGEQRRLALATEFAAELHARAARLRPARTAGSSTNPSQIGATDPGGGRLAGNRIVISQAMVPALVWLVTAILLGRIVHPALLRFGIHPDEAIGYALFIAPLVPLPVIVGLTGHRWHLEFETRIGNGELILPGMLVGQAGPLVIPIADLNQATFLIAVGKRGPFIGGVRLNTDRHGEIRLDTHDLPLVEFHDLLARNEVMIAYQQKSRW